MFKSSFNIVKIGVWLFLCWNMKWKIRDSWVGKIKTLPPVRFKLPNTPTPCGRLPWLCMCLLCCGAVYHAVLLAERLRCAAVRVVGRSDDWRLLMSRPLWVMHNKKRLQNGWSMLFAGVDARPGDCGAVIIREKWENYAELWAFWLKSGERGEDSLTFISQFPNFLIYYQC